MRKIGSLLIDKKVRGISVSLPMTIGEYYEVAKDIMDRNEYQRKKVSKRYNVYGLLKEDLMEGCIMPPIVLATDEHFRQVANEEMKSVDKIIERGTFKSSDETLVESLVDSALESSHLLILDGIQRTDTIEKAIQESRGKARQTLLKKRIRVEFYIGLTKYGILYRMLTLNTGQTPMTFRHQLEILFNDYLGDDTFEDIKIYRETDTGYRREPGKYRFSDLIDLYQAYMLGTPQSLDKKKLLEEIKELEFLESYERKKSPDMRTLIMIYDIFVKRINQSSGGWEWEEDETSEVIRPFGKNVPSFFIRPQAMSGFGSACSALVQEEVFPTLTELQNFITNKMEFTEGSIREGMNRLVEIVDEIQQQSTRYGPDQRAFFEEFSKTLLSTRTIIVDFNACALQAYERF